METTTCQFKADGILDTSHIQGSSSRKVFTSGTRTGSSSI